MIILKDVIENWQAYFSNSDWSLQLMKLNTGVITNNHFKRHNWNYRDQGKHNVDIISEIILAYECHMASQKCLFNHVETIWMKTCIVKANKQCQIIQALLRP